jgi:hypothetical protein
MVMEQYTLEQAEEEIADLRGQLLLMSEADTNTTTVTSALPVADLSTVYTVPPGSLPGTCYRLTAGGTGTQGSTVQALTFGFYLGGSAVGASPVVSAAAALWGINDAFRWAATALIVCASTGGSGTWFGSMTGAVTDYTAASVGAAGATLGFADANAAAFTKDTTVPQTFSIRAGWASATGAPTISCKHTLFERRLGT